MKFYVHITLSKLTKKLKKFFQNLKQSKKFQQNKQPKSTENPFYNKKK
jgi:hypothetical protein